VDAEGLWHIEYYVAYQHSGEPDGIEQVTWDEETSKSREKT